MSLTQREQEIIDLLRGDPMLDAAALAVRIGATKAAVAVHLSNLTKKGAILGRGYLVRREAQSVVVVGGANMDLRAHSGSHIQLRTSNPGVALTTPGGVGRNIAENLARLGSPTQLIAPVGRDAFGEQLVSATRSAGVGVDHLVGSDDATGTYLAVMDSTGELVVAVSNMTATDRLTVRQLEPARDLLSHADLIVIDGNIPPDPAAWLLDLAAVHGVRVVLDPVSVAKARLLAQTLTPQRPVAAITPNHDELQALVDGAVPNTKAGIAAAARRLHRRGVEQVWVRRGARGSLLSTAHTDGTARLTHYPAPRVRVVDVTGAGDAMTAAFVHALLRGDPPAEAARFGQMAAALTAASPETVRPDLTAQLIDAELRRGTPRPTKESP